jgi:hypothetical protein
LAAGLLKPGAIRKSQKSAKSGYAESRAAMLA